MYNTMYKYILIPLIMCLVILGCRQPWTLADTHKVSKPTYGVVFFTSKSCEYCQKMEKEVWSAPSIKKRLTKLSWHKVDCTEPNDNAKKYSKQYNVKTLPSIFFIKISEDGKTCRVIRRRDGYMGVAETLIFLREPLIK